MKSLSHLFLLLLSPAIAIPVQAAELKATDQITITQAVTDDLYLAAEKVTVSAPVTGDIVACGSMVRLNDTVHGDALLAAGNIDLTGYVTDDIRAFGGTVDIRGGAGGDLLVFGGTVIIHSDATIAGDVVIFGGDVEIHGTVAGNITGYGGRLWLEGHVQGNADLQGGQLTLNSVVAGDATLVAEKIELGSNARFNGPVRYWTGDGEMDFGAAAPNAVYDSQLGEAYNGRDNGWTVAGSLGFLLLATLASLLLAALLIFVCDHTLSRGAVHFRQEFFKSFGFGVLYVIGTPLALLVLMITVFGIPLALLGLFTYLFTMVFGPSFASVILAYWIRDRYNKSWSRWTLFWLSGAIFIALCLIFSIPVIGWLAGIVVVGAAFGSIILGISGKKMQAHS